MDVEAVMPSDAECAQMKAASETLLKAARTLAEQIGVDVAGGALTILAHATGMAAAASASATPEPDRAAGYFASVAANAVAASTSVFLGAAKARAGGSDTQLANLPSPSRSLN